MRTHTLALEAPKLKKGGLFAKSTFDTTTLVKLRRAYF